MRYCPSCHSVYPNEFRTCPKDQSELLAASELQPGMVLRGKYEILGKLGQGGMATVYRARHLAFDEVRAIKVVSNRLADDEDFLRRFKKEAVVARRLQHPNAVRVDDLDTTEDGRPFIVMEFVEGRNLRELVRHEGGLGLRRSVGIARQVASALDAAHALGIVHRDIKPDNILLTGAPPQEMAKVLDFGIAKIREGALGDSDQVATRTGTVVGTPQYISPEQAMGRRGKDLDGRADLYSLGVVLYEMVTGRLPFESDTAMGIILHHLQTAPTPPRALRPDLDIPAPLSDVLMRALEKDRDKRFASAAEMGAALDGVLDMPLPDRPTTPPPLGTQAGRPATPRPVPADIDRFETRDMPRTPPAGGPAVPRPAAEAARATPPGIPPLPATPAPPATRAAGGASTPIPQPTVLGPPRPFTTPPPAPGTPPPLPPPTAVLRAPPGKKKKRWWVWVAAAFVLFTVLDRKSSRSHRETEPVSPPAASEGVDPDVRDARLLAGAEVALRADPVTRASDIEVDVDGGTITLSGAATRAQARRAEELMGALDGVGSVRNRIERAPERAGEAPPPELPMVPAPSLPSFPPVGGIPGAHPGAGRQQHPEEVKRLLAQARAELAADNPAGAMQGFTAVLSLDPQNEEARLGMRLAARGFVDKMRNAFPHPPSPPPAPSAKP